jgi:antitoxin component YwqK of YwqJK toxin-antitoxin module
MKILQIAFIALSYNLAYGQELGTLAKPEQEKPKEILCTNQELRMVPDCNGFVYEEIVQIQGRDETVVYHRKSGKPFSGECKVCYNNMQLKMKIEYSNGRLIGRDTVYYENGNIQYIYGHDELGYGKEDGLQQYYRPDGSLKWEKNFVMGMADGEFRYYFSDSTIQKIEHYKNNQLHGKKQEFYKGNLIKKEIDYKNGMWDGTYITYFSDGKVESEQQYVEDQKDGPSSYYYNNGQLFYTENHEKGSREGTFKRMYATGRMWTKESYKNDKRDGEFEEYYDNEKNTIKYRATYKKGELISEMYYDELGGETMPPEKIQQIKDGESESSEEVENEKKNKRKKKK